MVQATKGMDELKTLTHRRDILVEAMKEIDDPTPFQAQVEALNRQIEEAEIHVKENIPEFKLLEDVQELANQYVEGVHEAYQRHGVELRRFPYPTEDGQLVNAPRVPGLPTSPAIRRQRTSVKGKILDLSGLESEISHSFRNGEKITGVLDVSAAGQWDGKPFDGKVSDLLNDLYKTPEGAGYYETVYNKGATQSAFTVFSQKAGGKLEDNGSEDDEQPISSNGNSKRKHKNA